MRTLQKPRGVKKRHKFMSRMTEVPSAPNPKVESTFVYISHYIQIQALTCQKGVLLPRGAVGTPALPLPSAPDSRVSPCDLLPSPAKTSS
ncbi:hypothetical protein CB1_000353013 [Camelus ferus]|nr:hypothetical protein CB1_000353013 [Camelus ferus]